jgi:RNA recognition motif-containing protein
MSIYIGNLHYNVNEDELREIFKKYGEVMSAIIIKDKYTGRSKGFGFIEMLNDEEADKAINNLHDTEIRGRKVIVNKARER